MSASHGWALPFSLAAVGCSDGTISSIDRFAKNGKFANYVTFAKFWCHVAARQIRGSIVVSISACHAEDPGSIPGRGVFLSRPPQEPKWCGVFV